jgi:hypothetical protein
MLAPVVERRVLTELVLLIMLQMDPGKYGVAELDLQTVAMRVWVAQGEVPHRLPRRFPVALVVLELPLKVRGLGLTFRARGIRTQLGSITHLVPFYSQLMVSSITSFLVEVVAEVDTVMKVRENG